jgi:hypothetical protein
VPVASDISNPAAKYQLSVLPAVGYTLQTRLAVIVAGNVAFYADADSAAKISSIYFNVAYTENNQFTAPIQSSIWTHDNKYNFVGDWRFMKYPQNTYGLGMYSDLDSASLINYDYFRFYQTVYRRINNNLYAGIGYNLDYRWDIREEPKEENPTPTKAYQNYGPTSHSSSSGLVASLLFDNRANSINPDGGAYANISYRYNTTWMGSDANWSSILIDARKYYKFPARSKNILAFWTYDWLVLSGKPPYLDLPSTAWDTYTNTGRGYIQGRFRSNQMLYLESEYRFGLTRNGLLGGVVFVNGQSFAEWPSNKFEGVQAAYGLGLRVKLNKVSKTNVDIDYGFGAQGSRGLFINIAEVF